MKKVLAILIFAVSAFINFAATTDASAIKAEGIYPRLENEEETKKLALEAAIRNAIAASIGFMADEKTISEFKDAIEKDIYPNAVKYISNYRILSWGWITNLEGSLSVVEEGGEDYNSQAGSISYHLRIEANVDNEKLREDLGRFVSIGKDKTQTIIIIIAGVDDYKTFDDLRETIEGMDVVKEITVDSLSRDRFVLKAVIRGSRAKLHEKLLKELSGDFIVIPLKIDKLVIRKEI